MEMRSIKKNYGPGESAVLAAAAGANMILFSHTREYQEEAYDSLFYAFSSGRLSLEKLDCSVDTITKIKEKYQWTNPPPLDVILSKDHQVIMKKAARMGTVLIKNEGIMPIRHKEISIIEFSLNSHENISTSTLIENICKRCENVDYLILGKRVPWHESSKKAFKMTKNSEVLLLATRNAHLMVRQREVAKKILEKSKKSILVCFRNPYDIGGLDAEAIICTNGDSTPSISSAVDIIFGDFLKVDCQ